MNRINVLFIGIKNWPYDTSFSKGALRGSGSNKYCNFLINNFSENVISHIITSKLLGQLDYEDLGNIKIYRINTISGRKLRLLSLDFLSVFTAFKIIKNSKIDIIHGNLLTGILSAYFIGQITKRIVVGTPFSIYYKVLVFPFNFIANYIEKFLYQKLDLLFFESNENLERAQLIRNVKYKNAVVINTGVDKPLFRLKDFNALQINILFVGRLVKVKAIDKLILSLKYLDCDTLDKIHIDIVGEGELQEQLKKLTNKYNLNNFITFHGFVESTIPFYQNAHIFILPSYSEGLSVALLEAMSYGLVCVVNNFGVPFTHEEVLEMKDNNPDTIAQSIKYLISNIQKMKQMSMRSKDTIEQNFSIDNFSKKYENYYKNILSRPLKNG